jgi:hypothetical protein
LLKAAAPVLLIVIASPALTDEGASGLYVPGNFGFGAGVTPDAGFYLSTGLAHYDGDIKIFIDGGKIVVNADKRPYSLAFAALWVPETKVLGGNLGLSLGSSDVFSWAHGEVTGLINADATVQGWAFGDTIARAQLGWNSGPWSNALYLTTWFPTGRYQRGFRPNRGKNHYGVNLGWGVTHTEPHTKLEFDSAIGVTFNAKNPATDYKDGDDFIWDWPSARNSPTGSESESRATPINS